LLFELAAAAAAAEQYALRANSRPPNGLRKFGWAGGRAKSALPLGFHLPNVARSPPRPPRVGGCVSRRAPNPLASAQGRHRSDWARSEWLHKLQFGGARQKTGRGGAAAHPESRALSAGCERITLPAVSERTVHPAGNQLQSLGFTAVCSSRALKQARFVLSLGRLEFSARGKVPRLPPAKLPKPPRERPPFLSLLAPLASFSPALSVASSRAPKGD